MTATADGTFVNLEKAIDGNLRMTLNQRGKAMFEQIKDIRNRFGIHEALRFLLADHFQCGWSEVRPEEIDADNSRLLITDAAERGPDGKLLITGPVYANPHYQFDDEIRQLAEIGSVVFQSIR